MATWTGKNKSADPSWQDKIRHGRDLRISEIANLTFNDELFEDGTLVKDATFTQISDTDWTEKQKSANPTWAQPNRN